MDAPIQLLLIDDEPVGLLALAEALERRLPGALIDTALSGRTALTLLRARIYHVIVSDVRMAGLDGLALLNQVRERWPDTPVVLVTGAGPDREAEALMAGAFAFIEKPLNLDRLVPILKAAVVKSRCRQAAREAVRQTEDELS